MTAKSDGRWIVCDGEDCNARALAVIALLPALQPDPATPLEPTGRLFVLSSGKTRHFCPDCAPYYLDALRESE